MDDSLPKILPRCWICWRKGLYTDEYMNAKRLQGVESNDVHVKLCYEALDTDTFHTLRDHVKQNIRAVVDVSKCIAVCDACLDKYGVDISMAMD